METPVAMVFHGLWVGVVLFLVLKFLFQVSTQKAESWAVLVGLVVSLYMVLFGHKFPPKLHHHFM
jgi:hypothetical protein